MVVFVVLGYKVVDDNNNILSDGEYEIIFLKVICIGSVFKDVKVEVEIKVVKY